jgi:hypothetical protein
MRHEALVVVCPVCRACFKVSVVCIPRIVHGLACCFREADNSLKVSPSIFVDINVNGMHTAWPTYVVSMRAACAMAHWGVLSSRRYWTWCCSCPNMLLTGCETSKARPARAAVLYIAVQWHAFGSAFRLPHAVFGQCVILPVHPSGSQTGLHHSRQLAMLGVALTWLAYHSSHTRFLHRLWLIDAK